MAGTNSMDTPRPPRVRPRMATPTVGACDRTTEPMKASTKKMEMVRRGPKESESRPAGNCMKA